MIATTKSFETLLNSLVAAMRQLDQRVEHWAQIEVQRGALAQLKPIGPPNGHLREEK
jgi:hypothetical protein